MRTNHVHRNTLPPMTQRILNHLVAVGTITNVEAQALYKCRALPRRIADIRAAGHEIVSVMRKDQTGQRYARYFMGAAA